MTEIVFVHLGHAPAPHLWLNIRSIKRNFSLAKITVVVSSGRHLRHLEKLDVNTFMYSCTAQDENLLSNLKHNAAFRKGFWRYSLERILALEALHTTRTSIDSILHLESDVLLLPDFPIGQFENISELTWCKFNATHDVSAVLFSPNLQTTAWLANAIREEIRENASLTDMTVLSLIQGKNPDKINYFPSLSISESKIFDGVFDGAAIGMWLTGRDPRNSYGLIQRHVLHPDAQDDPSKYKYVVRPTGKLFATKGLESTQVYNLHIHSKNKFLFGRFSSFFLKLEVWRTMKFAPSNSYSVLALLRVFTDHIIRHGWKSPVVIYKLIRRNHTR